MKLLLCLLGMEDKEVGNLTFISLQYCFATKVSFFSPYFFEEDINQYYMQVGR